MTITGLNTLECIKINPVVKKTTEVNKDELKDKGNAILQFQTITGVHGTIRIMATLITETLFEQSLICTAM